MQDRFDPFFHKKWLQLIGSMANIKLLSLLGMEFNLLVCAAVILYHYKF